MADYVQIVWYNQLEDKSDLYHLWAQSFGWLATPGKIDEWAKTDIRLKGTPIGVFGLVDGIPVSFVGVMEIPTRNKNGEVELVGGIWAIATRPSFARKGIGRRLLDEAEDYFRKRGIRLSMLTTSRAIVAHRWYSSVGYREVETVNQYPHFYKLIKKSSGKKSKSQSVSKPTKFDSLQALANFTRFMKNRCGFVFRDQSHFKYVQDVGGLDPKYSQCTDRGHVVTGVMMGSAAVREMIADLQTAAREMIRLVESRVDEGVYYRYVFDPSVSAALSKAGYRKDVGTFDVLMCKPLGENQFDDVYDSTFTISRSDFF